MRRAKSLRLGIAICLLFVPRVTSAQVGTASTSVTGVIKDTSGAVLPGVMVEASSPVLIEKFRTTVSDERGLYRLLELRPGTYSVTFTLPGFSVFRRDGLELPPNFTATVNVELKVGALAETLTVSGQTPLVDTKGVVQQAVMSQALLDAVPTNKSVLAFAALMPSVVTPGVVQDVGGSKGETSIRFSVHGSHQSDHNLLQDGMRFNLINADGSGRSIYTNPLGAQDIVLNQATGGSAEFSRGGVQQNIIPREGGNQFSGAGFVAGTGHRLQSTNSPPSPVFGCVTCPLQAPVEPTRVAYDFNGMLGGPLKSDKLWFMTSHRRWGRTEVIPGLYNDANLDDFIFTPDFSRPAKPLEILRADNIRLTWQATTKDKITASYDWQHNRQQNGTGGLAAGTASMEVGDIGGGGWCHYSQLIQTTWTRPATSKFLFEAGATVVLEVGDGRLDPCGGNLDRVRIQELNPSFAYNGLGVAARAHSSQTNQRFSMSYVTQSHHIKTGLFTQESINQSNYSVRSPLDVNGLPVDYTTLNGIPNRLTQFESPLQTKEEMRPEIGLFIQDRWTLGRLTLNLGMRYEYIHAYAPASNQPKGYFFDARSFPEVDCLPCWHDLNPRVGVAYDLFGDGKTAVKGGINRYVNGLTTSLVSPFEPVNASINNVSRSWTDSNGNWLPDCNLRDPGINGECGQISNLNFGKFTPVTVPDPNWITGFGKRGYNWQASVSIDRELMPGVAVSGGFYRTWYGNFTVTDNQDVTPADYSPYCVTAPSDPRLPGNISGQQICGLYDINPNKFGQTHNVITLASNYGKQTEVYNGGDFSFSVRMPGGGTVNGGWNIGNSISTTGATGHNFTGSRSSRCFVVDSPQQLFNCVSPVPYQNRFKVNGSYPLPWAMQVAGVYNSLPGQNYAADTVFRNAQISPTLGRNLSGGVTAVTINLLEPFSTYKDERLNQLDLRLSKMLRMGGRRRFQVNFDVYNVFNANTTVQIISSFTTTATGAASPNNTWQNSTQYLDPRIVRFSAQFDF